jgi:hypothetical protein
MRQSIREQKGKEGDEQNRPDDSLRLSASHVNSSTDSNLLPQTFTLNGAVFKDPQLNVQQRLLQNLAEITGRPAEEFAINAISNDVRKVLKTRSPGFTIVDQSAFQEGKLESYEIATVLLTKNRTIDELVSLVFPHQHPDKLGIHLKGKNEQFFLKEHQDTPEHLSRNFVLSQAEGVKKWIGDHKLGIAIGVLAVGLTPGLWYGGSTAYKYASRPAPPPAPKPPFVISPAFEAFLKSPNRLAYEKLNRTGELRKSLAKMFEAATDEPAQMRALKAAKTIWDYESKTSFFEERKVQFGHLRLWLMTLQNQQITESVRSEAAALYEQIDRETIFLNK